MKFNIKSSGDVKIPIEIDSEKTILELKQQIQSIDSNFPADRLRLIYSGKVLKDDQTVGSYNIAEGNTVHMVKGAAKTTPPQTSPQSAPGVPSTLATGATASDSMIEQLGAGRVNNLLNSMGVDINSPNFMEDMMNSPEFQGHMSRMMSDPNMIETMLNSPQFASLPPERREHMRQVMSSPL